ncbi:MAG: hypothetical protein JKY84_09330, partial [Emcibacteraceae bacterium]|nr:hypothetical protein [Emcibacteraceae bacterium]
EKYLKELIEWCEESDGEFTPSDFPDGSVEENVLGSINKNNPNLKNVYVFPSAGGLMGGCRKFSHDLSHLANFYCLQIPDLFTDNVSKSIDSLVEYFVNIVKKEQKTGELYILGWSFGGILAYKVAWELNQIGFEVKYVGMIDSWLKHYRETNSKWWVSFEKHIEKEKFAGLRDDVSISKIIRLIENNVIHLAGNNKDNVRRFVTWAHTLHKILKDLEFKKSNLYVDLYKANNSIGFIKGMSLDQKNELYDLDKYTSNFQKIITLDGRHGELFKKRNWKINRQQFEERLSEVLKGKF